VQTTIQRVANGSQFDGTAGAGLVTFAGINGDSKLVQEYVIYGISLVVQSTGSDAASIASGTVDLIDLTSGTLEYDGQTANRTADVTYTGGTSGATATHVADNDDGADGALFLKNIAGVFENNEALEGDDTFVAVVDGTLLHARQRLDVIDSGQVDYSIFEDSEMVGIPVGYSDDDLKTPLALRVVTTTMVGNGTLIVKWAKRHIPS
jgi:hypothetical protein